MARWASPPTWATFAFIFSPAFGALPWPAKLLGIVKPLAFAFLAFCLAGLLAFLLWRQLRPGKSAAR